MNTFFLIFIGLPALEIFLMIKIGGKIGALNTLALIFLTAALGLYFARVQGLQTLRSGIINLYHNKAPIYELMSGASIAFAALLLIIPGFLTDLIGFLLLIPVSRNILFKVTINDKNFKSMSEKIKKENKTIDGEIINKDKDEL
tara:strand:- start:5061 stop:5492 length:432 start_codon:yes stop_codon:yes gene_type:complete